MNTNTRYVALTETDWQYVLDSINYLHHEMCTGQCECHRIGEAIAQQSNTNYDD